MDKQQSDKVGGGFAGVEPYAKGRKTTAELIEAGERREQVHCGLAKIQAVTYGRKLRATMKGRGWILHVWQNLGWHYSVHRGAIRVHAVHNGRNARVTYTTFLADEVPAADGMPIGGAMVFHAGRSQRSFGDPNSAVAEHLRHAKAVIVRLQDAIASAAGK